MQQCKFLDKANDEVHGGIIDDSGNIICGCCGGLIESDEIGNDNEHGYQVIEIYKNWNNLDLEICGDLLKD